jgi:hypothetical protein
MMMDDNLHDEIKGTILERINKKELNHKIPDGYFEDFNDQFFKNLKSEAKDFDISRFMWIGIAASITILLGFFVCVQPSSQSSNLFQNADNESLIQYASNEMDLSDLTYEELIGDSEYSDFADLDDEILDTYIEDHADITELEEILEYL